MGRGIQRLSADSPATDASAYDVTEDLEVCDERSAHLPVRVPADDSNPRCMVGGGRMNLDAGMILVEKHRTLAVVGAYGGRSEYLESIGAPSESEVMARILAEELPDSPTWIDSWARDRQGPGGAKASNTRQEILNIFELALEHNFKRIAIVTTEVHVPRTATYVAQHMSAHQKYRVLSPVVFASETVLLEADPARWTSRVEALRNSQAFARNWAREAEGISKILRDVYGDNKPLISA
jgi:hypothetical protein